MTEVVFGYQMTDEAKAQDSVFAAGLMRLKNTNKINAEAIRARKIEKAKARGYLHRQDPIYSALGTFALCILLSSFAVLSTNYNSRISSFLFSNMWLC